MKTKIPLLLLSLALIASRSASARLNETEEQCFKRYGAPSIYHSPLMAGKSRQYYYCNWYIDVAFSADVARTIRYSKLVEISDREFQLILDAEGGRSNWHKVGARWPLVGVVWERNDGATAVIYKRCALISSGRPCSGEQLASNPRNWAWRDGYPVF